MTKIFTKEIEDCCCCPDCVDGIDTVKHCNKIGKSIPDNVFFNEFFPDWCPLPEASPFKLDDKGQWKLKKQDKPLEIIGTDLQGNKLKPPFVKS